jgi:hypothetical protein
MKVNIHQQLISERNKFLTEDSILEQVKQILAQDSEIEAEIAKQIEQSTPQEGNYFDFEKLETDRIFYIDIIKEICIDYRLRFLESSLFKGEIPQEAISKIKHLEKEHQTKLDGFMIMAPSKLFQLENYDDPLLFAPIGNGYYYLIHKWGNDLNASRKWLMYPFRNFDTVLISTIIVSLLLTFLVPDAYYNEKYKQTQFILMFFFMFKAVGFVILYFGISRGKNFNAAIWDSRYINA